MVTRLWTYDTTTTLRAGDGSTLGASDALGSGGSSMRHAGSGVVEVFVVVDVMREEEVGSQTGPYEEGEEEEDREGRELSVSCCLTTGHVDDDDSYPFSPPPLSPL